MNAQAPTILQILPELINGGVERGTVEMCQAIQERGWRAIVVSKGGPMVMQVRHTRADHIELPVHSKNPFVMLDNTRHLVHVIRKNNVSIIHARSRAPAWSALLASKITGVPMITTFHGAYKTRGLFKKFYNSVMTRGEKIIAVSNFMSDHIQKEYKVSKEKIEVIPRGVDSRYFHPDAVRAPKLIELTNEWRLPDDCGPVILMPARLTRGKGHHVLLKALPKLSNKHYMAILLGDDGQHSPYQKELEAMIDKYGLGQHVRFASSTRDMTEAYMLAEVVVCPSIVPESFGRVAIEAQAMGCCVIASNHGGARETIQNGDTGYLVEPDNAEQLAGAIEYCLNMDQETRDILRDNGQWWVSEHFSLDQMKQKTLSVYEEVLSSAE